MSIPASDPMQPDDPIRRVEADATHANAAPIEKKVKASTATAGTIVALLVTILSLIEGDQLIEGTPDWVPVLLSVLIAAGGTFAAGKAAPHTPRRDLPADQR